ncbi:MAG: THUMP domain-containing protein [Candidatus Bathyarchaeota archaeon]|nr:THUMP domain-containing protein [Candidatus Bathyarchaeota archaeon]
MRRKILVRVSGWHPSLPKAEVKAVLEAEGLAYDTLLDSRMLLMVESDEASIEALKRRCSYVRRIALWIASCGSDPDSVTDALSKADLHSFMESNRSFKVYAERLDPSMCGLSKRLEEAAGDTIRRRGFKVDLEKPDYTILCFIDSGLAHIGLQVSRLRFTDLFMDRLPIRRPALHPSTLQPDIARCLVNLSRAEVGDFLLDVFCGVGGILIEAAMLGCRVAGIDMDMEMLRKAEANLRGYRLTFDGLIRGDARKLPFSNVDRIVTDPPYGRASSTKGVDPVKLIGDFLQEAYDVVKRGGYLCFMSPIEFEASKLIENTGFTIIEKHTQRVHGNLTREIFVCRR